MSCDIWSHTQILNFIYLFNSTCSNKSRWIQYAHNKGVLGEGFLGVRVLELHLKCRVNAPWPWVFTIHLKSKGPLWFSFPVIPSGYPLGMMENLEILGVFQRMECHYVFFDPPISEGENLLANMASNYTKNIGEQHIGFSVLFFF